MRRAEAIFALLVLTSMAAGQESAAPAQSPEAPKPQTSAPAQNPQASSPAKRPPFSRGTGPGVIALLPPAISPERLTTEDKIEIYVHRDYGPQNVLLPLLRVSFLMAHPPAGFPHAWRDGGGAFGRLYGAEIAASTSNRTGQFLAQVAFHEDPRYVPSASHNPLTRTLDAFAFTFVDKTDSGHNTLALSNFVSAAAGGFVGMAFLPKGYNDATHAEQRALEGIEGDALRNLAAEFRPEWEPILIKLRIKRILPAWWRPWEPPPHH